MMDKLEMKAAVVIGPMGDHQYGFRQETTIWGGIETKIEFEAYPQMRTVTYPFTPFDQFWKTWEKY
ncbi:hypothetical protein N9940_02040 [bacterium]|nr:hypothetical protein [Akkermansiaceae bacterium]MDB4296346.1 hypothetical protein [bacterium]MDB4499148.1 hypothetical protein [Akkermansiaceae bacterium]